MLDRKTTKWAIIDFIQKEHAHWQAQVNNLEAIVSNMENDLRYYEDGTVPLENYREVQDERDCLKDTLKIEREYTSDLENTIDNLEDTIRELEETVQELEKDLKKAEGAYYGLR
jgi:predicted RNase H-like nuclease (RuvC/YqgF family)